MEDPVTPPGTAANYNLMGTMGRHISQFVTTAATLGEGQSTRASFRQPGATGYRLVLQGGPGRVAYSARCSDRYALGRLIDYLRQEHEGVTTFPANLHHLRGVIPVPPRPRT